jgi:hypothetical protein
MSGGSRQTGSMELGSISCRRTPAALFWPLMNEVGQLERIAADVIPHLRR